MDNTQCSAKGYCCKLFCSLLPVYVWLLAAGYVIHHIWLMPVYQQTATLWRPVDEMKDMMPWVFGYYAVVALLIAMLFWKIKKAKMQACGDTPDPEYKIGGKHCPIKFGVCFGAIVGLLIGAVAASTWIWIPIPSDLAVKWLIGWVVQGIGAGIILSLMCYWKMKKGCAAK